MNRDKSKQGISILVVVLCVAILAVAGGFAVYKMKKNTTTLMVPQETPATSMAKTTETPQASPTAAAMTATTGNTDADLDKDSADVSTKLNGLSTDSTSIDQGLNDQQGNLSEN